MNFAEQLKGLIDIVDVVQQYVPLKRQGSGHRWKGLCPFHSEKTPSFNVDGEHQFYKCFGCDAGGDVFRFVQQMESLTFPETLRMLAERQGIAMPERHAGDANAQRESALLEIQDAAATIFQDNLRSASGADARRYLQSRAVGDQAASEFRLGLADGSGQQMVRLLKKFGEELLLESGLVKRRDEGGLYDHFRSRLMFPIHSEAGKVIAFGGRALRPDDKIKYVNSPETKLYAKSSVLYNMHRAKVAARKNDRLILVEGYMDAIGVYSAGVQEVVALCGTALGPKQIRSMRQQLQYQAGKGHVILNLDSDTAGARSTEKHITGLLAEGLRVKVLTIPGELDPDEFIQQQGPEGYQKLLEQAPSYFHWLTDLARSRFDTRSAEGRVDAFKFVLPSLEHVQDRIERSALGAEIAEQLGVEREMVRQVLRPKQGGFVPEKRFEVSTALARNERLLIMCMLANADARTVIRQFFASWSHSAQLEAKPIFEAILAVDESNFSLSEVIDRLEPRLQRILSEINFSESVVSEELAVQQALDCLKSLETRASQHRSAEIKKQIREFEAAGNLKDAIRLMTELDMINRAAVPVE